MSGQRDGNWMDESGACKVCDGEIPHGHSGNCDIYKLERQVAELAALQRQRDELRGALLECEHVLGRFHPDHENTLRQVRAVLERTEGTP